MSYTVEQKVGNYIYVYNVESYWDKQKKQPRQTKTYLGKKDPETGKIISTQKEYNCWDYGNIYFLNAVSEHIGLTEILKSVFPESWQEILYCAFFEVSERKPLYLCNSWLDSTYSREIKNLPSQRISDLLKEIGSSDDDRYQFFKLWSKKRKKTRFIVFDITSPSSYSKGIDLLEWGYNRDGERLLQINLGVIYGEPSSLPLYYRIYPGSIHDARTLKNMIEYIDSLKMKNRIFILDKGFYSTYNLKKMGEEYDFIIPYSFNNKNALELIKKHSKNINAHSNAFRFDKRILFCVKDMTKIGGNQYYANIYLDEKKETEEREKFLEKVIEIEENIKKTKFLEKEEITTFLSETIKGWKKIFEIRKQSGKYVLKSKETGISETLERMGMTIFLSNKEIDGKEALYFYRRKDAIEKFFDNLKNELDRKRLRIHTEQTLEGKLFLDFISLILYSWIIKVMRNEGITKSYSMQELIYEFKKIRMIKIGKRKTVITEISKRQRELFKKFKIRLPNEA